MPVDIQLAQTLRNRLLAPQEVQANPFGVLHDICRIVSQDNEAAESHELVLRALDNQQFFSAYKPILDGLVRQIGLFPYLEPGSLSLPDLLAYEVHRPVQMDDSIVFHRAQAHVYHLLLAGENVALSAPTSFGKSLIIDAMVASKKFRNIVVVVPTLALIDETRRRLTDKFRSDYKIITRPSQERAERNVFVLTQERVIEVDDWSFVDFFVIDEFYKLSPQNQDAERAGILNQAFYALVRGGAQFYMLGPNIDGITDQNHLRIELRFIKEPDYHTVATEIHRLEFGSDNYGALVGLCRTLDTPTIIFCSSPSRASEVARRLVDAGLGEEVDSLKQAAAWIRDTYHPEWHFAEAISRGIGIHHGRIPRALAQFAVRSFNQGDIRFLVCTSTLIEGVNTRARNIVVFDNTINRERIDLFTFNNIKGRSGRMFEHFIGHVYVFHGDPQQQLPFVDVPVLSQSADAPDSLLVQMDESDLTEASRTRRQQFLDQSSLSIEVIRQNRGIDPKSQIEVAEAIRNSTNAEKARLAWTRAPRFNQLEQICELIFRHLNGRRLGGGSARQPRQLAAMISGVRNRLSTREAIESQLRYSTTADEAVSQVLDFRRTWATFHFPRLLRSISNIQREVLGSEGRTVGNYFWYAAQVESLFLDPILPSLEEFGVPLDTARKFGTELSTNGDFDEAFRRMRRLDLSRYPLSAFEAELVTDAIEHL